MAIRIRKNRKIFCAALNCSEEGDIYINDSLHYILSVELKILVTTNIDYHISNNGEWWWKGTEPNEIVIDNFYYE